MCVLLWDDSTPRRNVSVGRPTSGGTLEKSFRHGFVLPSFLSVEVFPGKLPLSLPRKRRSRRNGGQVVRSRGRIGRRSSLGNRRPSCHSSSFPGVSPHRAVGSGVSRPSRSLRVTVGVHTSVFLDDFVHRRSDSLASGPWDSVKCVLPSTRSRNSLRWMWTPVGVTLQ